MSSVVLVAGAARSGSTVLGATLGSVPGMVHLGEVVNLWRLSLTRPGFLCGCGLAIRECAFWQAVLRHAQVGTDVASVEQMIRVQQAAQSRSRDGELQQREFVACVKKIYAAAAAVTGAHTIVDTSKDPSYIREVAGDEGVDASVVHIVRDPRGHVISQHRGWQGRVGLDHPLSWRAATKVALSWQWVNAQSELVRLRGRSPGIRVRYEDFVAHPAEVTSNILSRSGEYGTVAHIVGQRVDLRTQHTCAGNPVRRQTTELQLRSDEAWVQALSRRHQEALFLLSSPLVAMYGYPRYVASAV